MEIFRKWQMPYETRTSNDDHTAKKYPRFSKRNGSLRAKCSVGSSAMTDSKSPDAYTRKETAHRRDEALKRALHTRWVPPTKPKAEKKPKKLIKKS